MSSAPIGVGVVGLGVGEQHARRFAADSRTRVRWLHDLDAGRAARLAAELPGSRAAEKFEQLLEDPEVQIVSIASFDDAHFAQASVALEHGKHVFVEKPLCRTWPELQGLKRRWSAAGGRLKLGSNLVLRAAPLYRWLKERVAAGALGTLYSLDGDYLYGRMSKITDGWRAGVPDYSVMLGGGIHLVDLALWISGERPRTVSARGNRICSRGSAFAGDDFQAATLEFASGLVARVSANFGCVHRHQHVLRVFGTEATFLYDDAGARLHRSRDPGAQPERPARPPLPAGKGDLLPEFVDAVIAGADYAPTQSLFDGIAVCLASDRAAASGTTETIEYA